MTNKFHISASLTIEFINFTSWAALISKVWNIPATEISIYNNPYSIIKFQEEERMNINHYFVKIYHKGEYAGVLNFHDINVDVTRIKGIFILPEFRNKGIFSDCFHELLHYMNKRIVGFYNENYQFFLNKLGYSDTNISPTSLISKLPLHFLFKDNTVHNQKHIVGIKDNTYKRYKKFSPWAINLAKDFITNKRLLKENLWVIKYPNCSTLSAQELIERINKNSDATYIGTPLDLPHHMVSEYFVNGRNYLDLI